MFGCIKDGKCNICAMVKWLRNDTRREKCARLIEALVEKPL